MSLPLPQTATASNADTDLAVARSGSTVAPLTHLGILQFSGEDAETFLQGQVSCDVESASLRSSTYGAYCSPKGRMLANFLLWKEEAGFLMALSRDVLPAAQKRLSMFVLRSKVKILDASESLSLTGIAGPQADSALRGVFPDVPLKANEVCRQPGIGTAIRLPDGRLVLAFAASNAPALSPRLAGSLKAVDARVWRWLDIRNGVPLVTAATQDRLVPQMANFELLGGVSFDKGCYTGQEVVARSQHLGKMKRRMFLANIAAAATAGDDLYSEDLGNQASGTIVNAEASPDGGYDVLAALQTASRENSTVHLKSLDGPVLRFLDLPYPVA
jgi:tRNA-modifying protein YgfZ